MKTLKAGVYWGLLEIPLVIVGLWLAMPLSGLMLSASIILFIIMSFVLGAQLGDLGEISSAFGVSQPAPVLGLVIAYLVVRTPADVALFAVAGGLSLAAFGFLGLISALIGGFWGEHIYAIRNRPSLRPLPPPREEA